MSGDFVKVFILFVHTICPTFLPFFFFQGQGKKSHCVCVTFLLIFIGEHRRATEKKKSPYSMYTANNLRFFIFHEKRDNVLMALTMTKAPFWTLYIVHYRREIRLSLRDRKKERNLRTSEMYEGKCISQCY